ncbi:MAG: protein translocase subunit SecF [Alphaproteobacteria bacterium]|nr:protein translocase subunit SecF [Alphaproteobacteria bacterium]
MWRLRLVPTVTRFGFMRLRHLCLIASVAMGLGSIGLFFALGINFGIDFTGGILIETRAQAERADLAEMRTKLHGLGIGDVTLQEFGSPRDVLIRIERQEGAGDAQQKAVERVRQTLGSAFEYRRVEFVGPQVSEELIKGGVIAVVLAILAQMVYVWFRFEWEFGLGSVAALVHDVLLTFGVLTFARFDFNLTEVAAVLLIIGYSMNDTVVVYDRVRENLRKYKKMPLLELLDLSVNETLSRTTMTAATTLIALIPLLIFGGEAIRGFAFTMIWGIFVGTYSSIFIAAAVLVYLDLDKKRAKRAAAEAASPPATP